MTLRIALNMKKARSWAVALGLLLTACGGASTRSSGDDAAKLPSAPPGTIWGDGYGATQREAVLDARRVVSEQLAARMQSSIDARESEVSGDEATHDVRKRVRTQSDFRHVELIKVHGVVRRGNSFVVRAVLDKDEAADVFREAYRADRDRLRSLGPVVDGAIVALDTSVLLSARQAPGELLQARARTAQLLSVLGRPARDHDDDDAAAARALATKASTVRQGAVLRLQVEGDASEALRSAAVGEVGALFLERGCQLTEAAHGAPMPGVPTADVTLRLATREVRETGVFWRYLGLEVEVVDARSGKAVFSYRGMPEIVHGGGKTTEQADQAAARVLKERLAKKAGAAFAAITCR